MKTVLNGLVGRAIQDPALRIAVANCFWGKTISGSWTEDHCVRLRLTDSIAKKRLHLVAFLWVGVLSSEFSYWIGNGLSMSGRK